jgi:hypothetical protein
MARTAVVAGTASAVSGAIRRHQISKAQEAARADLTGKLKELADLRDAGALSEAEFAAAKAKLLA